MKPETKKLLDEAAKKLGYGGFSHLKYRPTVNDDLEKVIETAIEKEVEDAKPKWISVEERLPEEIEKTKISILCLGFISCSVVAQLRYDYSNKVWFDKDWRIHNPTHWQPQPETDKL